ncbi:unnamed protein product [Arabis nemorensis]|uniref:Factor of DNA methylation 1-5/IDN2 domain-containing protein n=1 Tax=Arabis nemorensis TaxID=586526 RepID=A0A565BL47_9BRAS|nr:unnamed protein product [Arabis nemorensis]
MRQLVEIMSQSVEMKKICKQELEVKIDQTSCVLESLVLHNLQLNRTYEEETEKIHNNMQELELEIENLKGNANVRRHIVGSDGDAMVKMAKAQIDLEARETALQDKTMTLAQKERVTNDEYQDARKEMIQLWNMNEDLMSGDKIRVKRMGQLNPEPFIAAVKMKHGGQNQEQRIRLSS